MSGLTEDRYRGEAGQRYQSLKRSVPAAAVPWVCRLRAEKFSPYVQPNHTIVELGAGLGWNLSALQCARRIATDLENFLPSDSRIEFELDSAKIPAATTHVAICHHALEHILNPPQMLAEARRLLRDDGLLLLHVPFEKESRYRRFDPDEPNHHLYSWNVQTLGNLLTDCGFDICKIGLQAFGYDRAAASIAIRLGLNESDFRLLRRLALMLLPAYEIAAVARKKSG